jgi:hypothetical protein
LDSGRLMLMFIWMLSGVEGGGGTSTTSEQVKGGREKEGWEEG